MNPYNHVVRTARAFQLAHMQHVDMTNAYARKATDTVRNARDGLHKLKLLHRADMVDAITDALASGMLPDTLRNAIGEGLEDAKVIFARSVGEMPRT